ncbi:Uncharacterized protein Adt_21990 [Abeliophyllum distichum]|uniref:Uncharacterized protein n=1 Tax=Abeliophyllum distichum TaxID=126358 RepID=A0ABD1T0X5_9LAMI
MVLKNILVECSPSHNCANVAEGNGGLERIELRGIFTLRTQETEKFEVRHIYFGHINAVDLVAKTSLVRVGNSLGCLCGHVICSLESKGMSSDLMLYVSDCYKNDAYLRIYSPSVCPMTCLELWPNPGQHPLALPSIKKMPVRPKKARQRGPDEVQSSSKQS